MGASLPSLSSLMPFSFIAKFALGSKRNDSADKSLEAYESATELAVSVLHRRTVIVPGSG